MQKNGTGLFGSVVPKRASTGAPKVGQPEQPDGWRRAAGIFSDFASGMLGQPGQYGAMLEQRRQTAEAEASRQRQRGEQFADWRQQFDYQQANQAPDTPAPDAFDRALTNGGIDPTSPEGVQLYRDRAAAMARDPNDEFVVVDLGDGRRYQGPRSGMAEALGQTPTNAPPPRPIGGLTPMTGGPASNGGGTFRP